MSRETRSLASVEQALNITIMSPTGSEKRQLRTSKKK